MAMLLGLLVLLAAVPALGAEALPQRDAGRGELLYNTHCIACHNEQVHWRDKKLARDWPSLQGQVRRWQANARLNWNEADIREVSRYLNERHYRFQER
jgi:mono/diheme cytochrome c family protein